MKKTITLLTLLLLISTACKQEVKKPKSSLEQLQLDKKELISKMDSLSAKLKKIEISIHDLDTIKKLQKVTVFKIKDTVFNHYIALQGMVASDKNVKLRPEVGGLITRIFVKEGQQVRAGQTLIQLDASLLTDKVNELNTQLSLATTTYDRQARLWNQKIGTEMDYLGAKTQKEALENSLKSLYTQISKMKIKAPFSGVIDEVFAKTGELSGPQMPVIRLVNLNKLYVEAEVPETYLKNIKKETKVLLDFTSIDKQVTAKVAEIGSVINPANRSFKIKIYIPKDKDIKPNLLADLKINDYAKNGVVLPSNLIQMSQNSEQFVYVINENESSKTVEKRILEVGKSYNNEVIILNGLKTGETIVDKGGKFVKDGDEVLVSISK